jgi:PAS domain S-box-containing protein
MDKMKILMIEDDAVFSYDLLSLLNQHGLNNVEHKRSGEEALSCIDNNFFDLVLMDIKLDGKIDGIKTAKEILQRIHIPIIFISAYSDQKTLAKLGTDYYCFIRKPIVEEDLVNKIREAKLYQTLRKQCPLEVPFKNSNINYCMSKMIKENMNEHENTRAILNATTELLFLVDSNWTIIEYNRAFAERFSKFGKLLKGKNVLDMLPKPVADERLKFFQNCILEKKEIRFVDKNGDKYFDTHFYPIYNANNELDRIAVYAKDITEEQERKIYNEKLCAQLAESERMASIGLLSSTIAHEMNNSLNQLFNKLYLLQRGLSNDKENSPNWNETVQMKQILLNLSNLSQNILNYSQPKRSLDEKVDLRFIIVYVISFYKNIQTQDIQYDLRLSDTASMIDGDSMGLEIMLKNLISNAVKAMRGAGKIVITLQESKEDNVLLKIEDNGSGIPQSIIEKIFDPFYTTNREKGGNGLGLLLCKKIINDHGGTIAITSKVNEGTEVQITLPVYASAGKP